MRELIGVIFLMCIQLMSLMCSAIGGAWQSAGSMFHVFFVRCATRHDIKYALSPAEMAASGRMQKAPPPAASPTDVKWVN